MRFFAVIVGNIDDFSNRPNERRTFEAVFGQFDSFGLHRMPEPPKKQPSAFPSQVHIFEVSFQELLCVKDVFNTTSAMN